MFGKLISLLFNFYRHFHIVVRGSIKYNYKGTHITILLALCDANNNFTCVDIGMPGSCSDGVLRASEMGRILQNNFNFPEASPISEHFKD